MHTEEADTRDECVGDDSESVPVSDVADSDSDGGFMSSAAQRLYFYQYDPKGEFMTRVQEACARS